MEGVTGVSRSDGREELRTEVLAGWLLLVASPLLPWFRFYAAGQGDRYGGIGGEFWEIAIPVWAFSAVILVAGLVMRGQTSGQVAQIASITGAILAACLIGACEVVAAILPGALMPDSVRDALFDLRGSFGPWMALVGSTLVVFGLSGRRISTFLDRFKSAFLPSRRKEAAMVGGLYAAAVAALWWVRHQPWVEVTAGDGWTLPVWISGTPLLGAISLLAIVLLVGAVASWFLARPGLAVALAGLGGWTFTFLAALFTVSALAGSALIPDSLTLAQAAEELGVPVPADLVDTSVMEESVNVEVAWGAWTAYLLGLVTTFAAISTVRLRSTPWKGAP